MSKAIVVKEGLLTGKIRSEGIFWLYSFGRNS